MRMKVEYFEIRGNLLKLYVKKTFLQWFRGLKKEDFERFDSMFENGFENYLGTSIDESQKYIILTFVLRSKKDFYYKELIKRDKLLEELKKTYKKIKELED